VMEVITLNTEIRSGNFGVVTINTIKMSLLEMLW
jgi:hypothetical protein